MSDDIKKGDPVGPHRDKGNYVPSEIVCLNR